MIERIQARGCLVLSVRCSLTGCQCCTRGHRLNGCQVQNRWPPSTRYWLHGATDPGAGLHPWPPSEWMPGTEQRFFALSVVWENLSLIPGAVLYGCTHGHRLNGYQAQNRRPPSTRYWLHGATDRGAGLHPWPPPERMPGTEQVAAIDAVPAAQCHGSRRGAAPMATV